MVPNMWFHHVSSPNHGFSGVFQERIPWFLFPQEVCPGGDGPRAVATCWCRSDSLLLVLHGERRDHAGPNGPNNLGKKWFWDAQMGVKMDEKA